MGGMTNREIIQEIGIGVAVSIISTAVLNIKPIWEKACQRFRDWHRDNEVLKSLGKSIGYTPWTARRKIKEAMKEIRRNVQAPKYPWQKSLDERTIC